MSDCGNCCFEAVQRGTSSCFRCIGEFIGSRPIVFIVLNIVVFGCLGIGLIKLKTETDLEKLYFPKNSRAVKDRQFVRDTFPDLSNTAYNPFSQSELDRAVNFIFTSKQSNVSIFDPAISKEIDDIVEGVKKLTTASKTFNDVCAKINSKCLVDGEYALKSWFKGAVSAGTVTFPLWHDLHLDTSLAGVKIGPKSVLLSAEFLKVSFKLTDSDRTWTSAFLKYASDVNTSLTSVMYETPFSLNDELDKSTKGDIIYFSLTMTVVCTYASLVSTGGDNVSTRGALAFGGILAAGLGILGSMGLLCLLGVKYVNMVGVVPFLIIGIGVDDMFLLMSAWSENIPSDPSKQNVEHVPWIIGQTLASAGVGITITSVTDFISFLVGSFSVFQSVTNFSLYAGVAVIFCYIANATLFTACLALHGRRVYSGVHNLTCKVTKPKEQLKQEGKSACYVHCCGGEPPRKPRDDESICERFPAIVLPPLFRYNFANCIILALFGVYLAVAIYGAVNLKQGLRLHDLVQRTSYYHTYLTMREKHFSPPVPIAFVVSERQNYVGGAGDDLLKLLNQAQKDPDMTSNFSRCWLTSYRSSPLFNPSAPENFVANLQTFLNVTVEFQADVVLDSLNTSVVASRCYVIAKANSDQYANAKVMEKMRKLADGSSLPVFAFHPAFVPYEQFLAVLPATLLLVGIAVAVMAGVTFALLPHPLMAMLVMLTIVMILTGIFGFMYYLDLTLSSITMIHLIMSVGFSVDFSAHVCAAYLHSHAVQRKDRAGDAIRHAAAPITNGATSTFLGIMFLAFSSSYIFQSFLKVMVLVIGFGFFHAVFFLPAVLSLCGPENRGPASHTPVRDEPDASATKAVKGSGNAAVNPATARSMEI